MARYRRSPFPKIGTDSPGTAMNVPCWLCDEPIRSYRGAKKTSRGWICAACREVEDQ